MSAPIKDGSQDPQNKNSNNNKKMNLNEDDFDVKDVQIHTMKSDLADFKNPPEKKITIKSEDAKEPIAPEKDSGPFFQKETPQKKDENKTTDNLTQLKPLKMDNFKPPIAPKPMRDKDVEIIKPQKEKAIEFTDSQEKKDVEKLEKKLPKTIQDSSEIITAAPEAEDNSKSESHGIGRAVTVAVIIFIIIIVGAGGYYFWMTRVSTSPQVADSSPVSEPEPLPEPEEVLPELSDQNSNYLMIDLSSIDTKGISEILKDYSAKISQINTTGLYEFLITDENNTPIKFEDFASMLGLAISSDLLSQIGPDFSLYIYNYGDKTRLGLSISLKDSTQAKLALSKNESSLAQGLSALYLDNSYSTPTNSFSDAVYDKAPTASIRYINITNSEDMALDYAILNNQLIFGTTKATTYSIIDRLLQKNSNTDQAQTE